LRGEIGRLASGRRHRRRLSRQANAQNLVYIAIHAVRDQSIEHAPLTIFGLAALVLVLFMMRT
jgi:hypothetical protein